MNPKMEAKRMLNGLWHMGPCSDIFMFHHVTAAPDRVLSLMLDTDAFLRFLDRPHGYAPLDEVMADKTYGGKAALTFDDGLLDAYTIAYPAMKERNLPFTLFITTHWVGKEGYLSLSQLRELYADPLCTIGPGGGTGTTGGDLSVQGRAGADARGQMRYFCLFQRPVRCWRPGDDEAGGLQGRLRSGRQTPQQAL